METYGIIGAMDVEVALWREALAQRTDTAIGDRLFSEGFLGDARCVVVQCGVGMVNAAACTQALIDRFAVSCVINTGIAGSLDASIDIGDVVVATDAVNWVMDVQNLGYAAGQTPGLPQAALVADARLREAALKAACTAGARAHEGRVASGDLFVRRDTDKSHIAETFGARCCEMEGAAVAQVCTVNHVPFAIVRAISDKADGSAAVDYPTFEAQAAHDCAALTQAMVALLATSAHATDHR
ncbi:5'-methylthioadenosine/adenosylhomocysteine nucleosidase [uncultured Adlercreutzia sp.]|uniref:5'-methylthioadenosine/adenosylhomocysteine nucleosidase n=1 Tax=uncultured Adlercreutzia sp. TaxID=875803 RepID=UPI0026F3ED9D|nr:5'-methylthioadenosine/adenosylhomocysteine nucleosidase [uncultured Adlercreutzia sp.]